MPINATVATLPGAATGGINKHDFESDKHFSTGIAFTHGERRRQDVTSGHFSGRPE